MRIAYLCSRYPAVSHTFVVREVAALRRRGVAIDTFTIRRSPREELLSEGDLQEDRSTFAVLPVPARTLLRAHAAAVLDHPLAYLSTLARALGMRRPGLRGVLWQVFYFAEAIRLWRECASRALEHIHVHFANVSSDVALLAAHFGRRSGAGPSSWSLTVHGPTEFYDLTTHKLADKVRDAAFVACISDFARSQLMGLVEETGWSRLHVVRCGVDPEALKPLPGPTEELRQPPVVLTVGRLSARKGHAVLLHALAQLAAGGTEINAVIAGDGGERRRLERLAASLGVSGQVRFLGVVGQDELPALYGGADMFCLPSFGEGVPVVLMEAMASGVPVVASNVMGVSELVEHDRSGILVPPGRSDALASALRNLVEQPELRVRLAQQARERVVSDYDVHRNVGALADLLATAEAAPP